MKEAGVPCVPGSEGILETYEDAVTKAREIGYPVMIKVDRRWWYMGMRAILEESDLQGAWDSARREAAAAFGNDGMYMEKLILEPRHIEVQLSAIASVKLVT